MVGGERDLRERGEGEEIKEALGGNLERQTLGGN